MKLNPLILDLKGTILEAYHADMTVEPITGEVKEKINTAEHGFAVWLSKIFDNALEICESPIHMIAVVDDGNTYRKAMFPAYKQKRAELKLKADPIELEQIEKLTGYVKQFLAAMGVPLVRLKGQEADDVIAYFCKKLKGHKTIITNDKDLVVLAAPDVTVLRGGHIMESYTSNGVVVPPHLVSLFLSVVGDSADGFPGLDREGPKAWEKMVEQFGVDGMEQLQDLALKNDKIQIKAIASIAGNKTLTKLAENYDQWRVQFLLAQLNPSLCEGAKVSLEWYVRAPTKERLVKVLTQAGAWDLVSKYETHVYKQTLVTEDNLSSVLTEINELSKDTIAVAWDYETFDTVKNPNYVKAANGKSYVDVLNSAIAGCSFALGPNLNHVYYFSVHHANTRNVGKEWVLTLIKHFEDEGIEMVAQNIGFESTITKVQLSHEVKYWNDTKAYAHHIDENGETGLKQLSKRYLNYDQVDYHTTLKNAGASDMSEISGEQVLSYGCDDSLVTAHLYRFFTILTQLENTYDFIQEYECPAVAPLTDSYIQGVKIDVEEMERQAAADRVTVTEKMVMLRELLKERAINPNYPAVDALYEDQKAYNVAKAHERLKDGSAAEKDAAGKKALADYLTKLKDNCRYIEPYEIREFEEFIPTPAKLKHVTTLLGLPPCEKVTKSYLTEWLSDNPGEFADLLAPAVAEFKTRSGDNYDKLVAYCNKVLHDAATPTMCGTELNLGSPNQMQYLLYLLLGLPIRVRTKVQKKSLRHKLGLPGSPSTDASAIDFALANDCNGENAWKADVLKTLRTYAAAATRLSIYWTPYPLWVGEDHIMHPNFISPGTVTRRPTGSSPNLLQVSKGNVRKIFVPRSPDNVIASIDFASQELRVMAAITGDENFLSAYTGPVDKDLHAMTACGIVPSVYGKYEGVAQDFLKFDGILIDYDWFKEHQDDDTPVGKMLKDVRGMSKTVNFGVGYGAVAATVSQQAMIPLDISELAVNGFHAAYPGVNKWKESAYAFARQHGYVATTYGSRRHCGNALNSGTRSEIGRWERQLSNFLIQGQCADLLKVVLANAHKTGLFKKHGAMLIAPIYDEILVEVPRVSLHAFLHDLADLMEINMPGICVKMVADCSFGANWGKQEEVGARPTLEKINEALAKVDAYLAAKQSAQPGVTNEIQTSLDSEDDDVLAIVDESDTGTDL